MDIVSKAVKYSAEPVSARTGEDRPLYEIVLLSFPIWVVLDVVSVKYESPDTFGH